MARRNLADLQALCPPDYPGRLCLFLDFHPDQPVREVPDPYYGGEAGFSGVLDLVETASRRLLADLRA